MSLVLKYNWHDTAVFCIALYVDVCN
jgi:hypothetical protein